MHFQIIIFYFTDFLGGNQQNKDCRFTTCSECLIGSDCPISNHDQVCNKIQFIDVNTILSYFSSVLLTHAVNNCESMLTWPNALLSQSNFSLKVCNYETDDNIFDMRM